MTSFVIVCLALFECAFALPSVRLSEQDVRYGDYPVPSIRLPDVRNDAVLEVVETEPLDKSQMALQKDAIFDKMLKGRIVGGLDAEEGQFPYMASIRNEGGYHLCGGAIINNVYIVTACHCTIWFSASELAIVVGSIEVSNTGEGTWYPVSRIINHPEYYVDTENLTIVRNDISLIRTASAIAFGDLVSSIPIASGHVGDGFRTVFSGWGLIHQNGSLPTGLQYLNSFTISNSECAAQYTDEQVVEGMVCTFLREGAGFCSADSGGPLVVQNILVGIASWGIPCAVGYPDVFTRVSSYVQWIQENAT